MSDIGKSIVLGVVTISFWLIASIFLKVETNNSVEATHITMEYIKH